jgi:hypothetical protein
MYLIDSADAVLALPSPAALSTEGFFSEGNSGAGQLATVVSADWLNAVQGSLIAFLTAAGLAHSKSDYSRLWQAIGRSVTFQDTGSADHLVIALPAGLAFPSGSIGRGTQFWVKVVATNTGGSVDFAPFGASAAPVVRMDGSTPPAGHLLAGSLALLINDGAGNWQCPVVGPQAIRAIVGQVNVVSFTAAGAFSWTVPAGVTLIRKLTAYGAGGAGGWGNGSGGTASGGSAGATGIKLGIPVTPGQVVTGVVGAAGSGNIVGTGGAGGNSTVAVGATTYTAPGGPGGLSSGAAACNSPALASAPTNFDAHTGYRGGQGFFGFTGTAGIESGQGGAAVLGGQGGVGGGGVPGAGIAPGGGGGGSGNAAGSGGNGAAGAVYIEY